MLEGLSRCRLEIGKHKYLAVGIGLQRPVGVNDTVEREAASDVADDRRALRGQGQCIRDETSKLMESTDPMHSVVLGNEDGPGGKLVEVWECFVTGQPNSFRLAATLFTAWPLSLRAFRAYRMGDRLARVQRARLAFDQRVRVLYARFLLWGLTKIRPATRPERRDRGQFADLPTSG
jgi:hypothetical protein